MYLALKEYFDRSWFTYCRATYIRATFRSDYSFCAQYICDVISIGNKSVRRTRVNSSYLDAKCETILGLASRYLECSRRSKIFTLQERDVKGDPSGFSVIDAQTTLACHADYWH